MTENRTCFLVWGSQPFPPRPGAPLPRKRLEARQAGRAAGEAGAKDHLSRVPGVGDIELLPPWFVISVSPAPGGAVTLPALR